MTLETAFRDVMARYAASVTVVTSVLAGEPVGMTATAVISVSVNPPLLLVSLTKGTRTAQGVAETGAFAVHLLRADQQALASQFAAPGGDRFRDVPYARHPATGVPVLDGVLAYVVCRTERTVGAADHQIFIGAADECAVQDGAQEPLLYFSRNYRALDPRVGAAARVPEWASFLEEGLPGWGVAR